MSKAVYVTSSQNELFWLSQAPSTKQLARTPGSLSPPAHARSILGCFESSLLHVGTSLRREGLCLQYLTEGAASRLPLLNLACAVVWQPTPIHTVAQPEIVNGRVRQLFAALQSSDPGNSLGLAIPLISALAHGDDTLSVSCSNALIAAALPLVGMIARACRARDLRLIVRFGRELIGLGVGLTPSGDDLLGGLFFVAYHLRASYPSMFDWDMSLLDDLLEYARTRTNLIS